MVDVLIENLVTLIQERKEDYDGIDVKHIVESIIMLMQIRPDDKKIDITQNEELMKIWMFGGGDK